MMASTSSASANSRHSLNIRKMDNGYSVEHSRATWPASESEYGGHIDNGKGGGGRRTSESWNKIARTVDELHDLVDESFGTKRGK